MPKSGFEQSKESRSTAVAIVLPAAENQSGDWEPSTTVSEREWQTGRSSVATNAATFSRPWSRGRCRRSARQAPRGSPLEPTGTSKVPVRQVGRSLPRLSKQFHPRQSHLRLAASSPSQPRSSTKRQVTWHYAMASLVGRAQYHIEAIVKQGVIENGQENSHARGRLR